MIHPDHIGQLIYQWIDLIWAPIALCVTHKGHRLMAVAFVLTCAFSLRLQAELMHTIGYDYGILGLIPVSAWSRGLVVYGVVIAIFLLLAHFSEKAMKIVFLGAALSIYVLAFAVSMLVMVI